MKVNADTITDEQIRELRLAAYRAGERSLEYDCTDAIRRGVGRIAKERKAARERVAAAWNARHGGES